jgi:flagellar basal-body rod protein FlgC
MAIDLIPAISISSSGLQAERVRMEVTANNLANVHSSEGPDGQPFQRQVPVFASVMKDTFSKNPTADLGGVKVSEVANDQRAPIEVFAPYHPDADEEGMVEMPNISPIEEMIDMITATRAYEANLSVIRNSKKMAEKTIEMAKS